MYGTTLSEKQLLADSIAEKKRVEKHWTSLTEGAKIVALEKAEFFRKKRKSGSKTNNSNVSEFKDLHVGLFMNQYNCKGFGKSDLISPIQSSERQSSKPKIKLSRSGSSYSKKAKLNKTGKKPPKVSKFAAPKPDAKLNPSGTRQRKAPEILKSTKPIMTCPSTGRRIKQTTPIQ